jgi:23S rRNA (cytosine1962-C5)-methyltransferase
MTATPLFLRKDEERRLLAGHDWIYSNEIDTGRSPLKGLEPGQAVELFAQSGRWLAHAYANPQSLISARVTSRDKARPLTEAELHFRLQAAAAWRERLYPGGCYRWIYGESDGLPGLVIDRYGSVAVAQITTAGMDCLRPAIAAAVEASEGISALLLRCDGDLRQLEGLDSYVETAFGSVPDEVEIVENGNAFLVPLKQGQKTGWFYDQADNRLRGRALLKQGRVVDVCSYVGGWGVTAALAGAAEVVCVDASELALGFARRNAERNGVARRMSFMQADAAEAMRELSSEPTVNCVVLDPPAFVKRKKDLPQGSAAYQRWTELALGCLQGEGYLINCSCSQHMDRDDFLRLTQKAARRSGRFAQLLFEGGQSADHPVHPAMPETRYLKALFLRATSEPNRVP